MVYPPLYRVLPVSLVLQMMFLEVGVTLPPPEDIPEEIFKGSHLNYNLDMRTLCF